ncbi:hypothetical protein KFL_011520010 [Klebsormidium nitens]|uniref:Uncharacterized protein n=1 Tax=Klebsormidium nitens TaxID=105231 RepID=A0A1Y1IPI7_KLENI|nr:hypothetical protein KFL_011520010 [Klebsormidium nitens]|eukprot:GAQ92815.1 hypothetical protein KFL_011520010 [Klebsormidium nitens]
MQNQRASLSTGGFSSQSAFQTPSRQQTSVSEANVEQGPETTSPLKKRTDISPRHYFETLLASPMFKRANLDSAAKEDHGIKQWLLHNIVWFFIVKKGLADLTNLYAGKQDGIIINKLFKPKEATDVEPQQTGVRSANGLVVDAPTLERLANASSSGRSIRQQHSHIAQQVHGILDKKRAKSAQLANTFRDGDPGDKGLRRRFLVLNERFLSPDERQFSFAKEWATVHDRGVDPEAKRLFAVFETENIEEFNFLVGPMLEGEYGVAPWSTQIKVLPQTPASHNFSSEEEAAAPAATELPFCTFDLEDRVEVRVSRPFCPFETKKEVTLQECDELEDAIPPKNLLILGGKMPEYLDYDFDKFEQGLQHKRKYDEISTTNFPVSDWRNEISLPYSIDRSESKRSIQAGAFVISFKKRPLAEKRKLILNADDDSDND